MSLKKLLLASILGAFLVGCGDSYKTLNTAEKINLAQKAIVEDNQKARKELKDILIKIKKASEKGDEKAEFELTVWKEVIENAMISKSWSDQAEKEYKKELGI